MEKNVHFRFGIKEYSTMAARLLSTMSRGVQLSRYRPFSIYLLLFSNELSH